MSAVQKQLFVLFVLILTMKSGVQILAKVLTFSGAKKVIPCISLKVRGQTRQIMAFRIVLLEASIL